MTDVQRQVFALICRFAEDVVLELVVTAGRMGTSQHVAALLPVAEQYFNDMVWLTQTRKDNYVNTRFDEICRIPLGGVNHPIDRLQEIVFISLHLLTTVDISCDISDASVAALEARLSTSTAALGGMAAGVSGCTHTHEPLQEGEKVFSFHIE